MWQMLVFHVVFNMFVLVVLGVPDFYGLQDLLEINMCLYRIEVLRCANRITFAAQRQSSNAVKMIAQWQTSLFIDGCSVYFVYGK